MSDNIPDLLSYPKILPFKEMEEIRNQFVYPIKEYRLDGIAALVKISKDLTICRIGDWDGKPLDPEGPNRKYETRFMSEYLPKLMDLMCVAKIPMLQLYISCDDDNMVLVDVRTALDKFCSPGFINDIFGKIMPCQEKMEPPAILDDEKIAAWKGKGLILKPSFFKTILRGNELLPMYASL